MARSLRTVLLYSMAGVAALHGHPGCGRAVLHRQVQVAHQLGNLCRGHVDQAGVNSLGWLVVKRMRSMPGNVGHVLISSAKSAIPAVSPILPR